MSAQLLDGKALSNKILDHIACSIKDNAVRPKLCVVSIGEDSASKIYVRNKQRACEKCGVEFNHVSFAYNSSYKEVTDYVFTHINCPTILQLPINHKNPNLKERLLKFFKYELYPEYDVDGFGFNSVLSLYHDFLTTNTPCTPAGICKLLETIPNFTYEGKHVTIIGRSTIVGKPLALILLNKNCTVTVCHSKTRDLPEITRNADIIISAVGQSKMVTKDMVKPGAIVIDVGMNRDDEKHLCGDVDFENVKEVASYITPVPGGVGPMTVAMLMYNVYKTYECDIIN